MNIGTVAIIGSILAGLLSIPATGTSITGDITAAGATVSGMSNTSFQDTPRTVTEEISPDAMTKTVETAFGTVRLHATAESFSADLETPRSHVTVQREAGEETVDFTGRTVALTIDRSPDSTSSTCETPQGTLTTATADGERRASFSGVHRQEVNAACDAARARLEQQMERINTVAADVGLVPDVDIVGINETAESATVRNTGETQVDLRGWKLSDGSDNTYAFDIAELGPGETVTVYSDDAGDPEACTASSAPDYERCWDSSFVWNDDGETATLRNAQDETADTFTYQ
ncbi:MAG: lamin tail domain-containing protein [Candidatus Nanohaloarchaea archaeon]|nr:lamin tail domain-containing protein [Candidatus Nanohaloarchaea archaeon]